MSSDTPPWRSPMLGVSHAATGLLTGAVLGAAAGSHPLDVVVGVAVGAGAALLPDLDEPGSTVGRSLGAITRGTSKVLRAASTRVYRSTATAYELRTTRSDGGHRYLTHTIPAVVLFGGVAWGVAVLGALGLGVVVFAMAALGLACVVKPFGRKVVQGAGVTAALIAGAAVVVASTAPWLVACVVSVGALAHVLGDWLTRSGVPLAWPLKHRGKRWWMFRSPVAFVTGQSPVEVAIRWVCLVGAPVVGVLSVV